MFKTFALSLFLSQAALATSVREPALAGSRAIAPVIHSGVPFVPEIRNEIMDILDSLSEGADNFDSHNVNDQDEAKKLLTDFMNGVKNKNTPLFRDLKTGKVILSQDFENQSQEGQGADQLKGCLSRTHSTGSGGEDRKDTTWEICVSSD